MSEIVFVLGAGASRQAGAPLMDDFLDKAEDLLARGQVNGKDHFERVFSAIHALQPVDYKSSLDLDNLESVYAAFEMAALLGRLSDWEHGTIARLTSSMRHVIKETLEGTIAFPMDSGVVKPSQPYEGFAKFVTDLSSRSPGGCSVLTFNYDLCLDYAFAFLGKRVTYGLCPSGEREDAIPLLKLHGSLNWLRRRDSQNTIFAVPLSGPFRTHDFRAQQARQFRLCLSEGLPFQYPNEFCREEWELEPVLVPPTWAKGEYQQGLASVWARAAAELADAKSVVVIGYSLPETDSFFRHLFALGTLSCHRMRRFLVYNPDRKVSDRFEALIGRHVQRSYRFFERTFSEALLPQGSHDRDYIQAQLSI